ncbi:hypothetical protein ACFFF5_07365 [Lederbergia wuyishanensis]|uniref:Uncharacterized protein n=1 Tax=Lederbergia wuyishanensis TaxID=1347903 RepID=A0ABU0D291_9BACI|nr:hypothetical protein [Lederbergia wuyishanensis]MCJ8007307.1 hypothetical protein [Lederbergia wuyishanensis]MDQ0342530.1 hypothetical protein [Lederbergia wuyishanensis]
MIKIYTNLTEDLLRCANEKINDFIESYFEFNDDDFSDIFPNIIYETKEKQCRQAAKDLYLWSKDDFVHTLTPLHEYALYSIINISSDIDEDHRAYNDGESLFFYDIEPKIREEYSDIDENDPNWVIEDLIEFDFYLENCFQDHDFLDVPLYLSIFKNMPTKKFESQFGIVLADYVDLMPPDIEEEYRSLLSVKALGDEINEVTIKDDFFKVVKKGIDNFVHSIINHGSYKLLWFENYRPRDEKAVQLLFMATSYLYFQTNNIDVSPEANIGRGPIDFKLSRGVNERILIEVKLASNPKLRQGLNLQLVKYLLAEDIKDAVFMVIVYEEKEFKKLNALEREVDSINQKYNLNIMIVSVDATNNKPSASKLTSDFSPLY